MAPLEPPIEIILRVKVPPGHLEGDRDEFSVGAIYTSLTVGIVRQRIQQLLPSNPAPERQRILYGGRALVDNDQTLAEALNTRRNTSQTEYVIHLLVKDQADNVGPSQQRRTASTPLNADVNEPRIPQALSGNAPPQLPGLPNGQHVHSMLQQRQIQMQHQMRLQQQHMVQQGARLPVHGGFPVGRSPIHTGAPMPPGFPAHPHQQQAAIETGRNGIEVTETALQAPAAHGAPHSNPVTLGGGHAPALGRPVSGQGFHVQGVGPDGNRFEIHQQTLNIPGSIFPGQMPIGMQLPQLPGIGLPFPMPGMVHQQPQAGGPQPAMPSALDRARQNVAEMRGMLDQMRAANGTEEERARVTQFEQHMNAVNDYIDPFRVGRQPQAPPAASSLPLMGDRDQFHFAPAGSHVDLMPMRPQMQARFGNIHNVNPQQPGSTSDVSCFLLSSPTGPQALLFSPQHGQYTGRLSQASIHRRLRRAQSALTPQAVTPPQLTPAPTQVVPADGVPQQAAAAAPPPDPAVAQIQQGAAQDPVGPMQPLINNFWLLFRVMIFVYFLLGANMGWRRPVALALIGLGFWMIRAGLFGDNGIMRRWWEGVIGVEQAHPRANAHVNGNMVPGGQPTEIPTPEQLAQRLLQQRQERLNRAPLHRLREQIRPLERAAALFFASLWPGVGEAHVRAQEAEERRRDEEEIELRRMEEESRAHTEQQTAEKAEGGAGPASSVEAGRAPEEQNEADVQDEQRAIARFDANVNAPAAGAE